MSSDSRPLALSPRMKAGLPLGYQRIFVSESILDEETTAALMLEQPKYRHRTTFVRHPGKQLSKLDIEQP